LLDWKGHVLHGKEVVALQKVWNEAKRKWDIISVNDKIINDYPSSIGWERYCRVACMDFTWFQNTFPDLFKSKDGQTIATIFCNHAAWPGWERWTKMEL
jgi:hypothetical protein